MHTGKLVSGVRIPLSPQAKPEFTNVDSGFFMLISAELAPADMSMKKAKKTLLRFRVWLAGLRCRDDLAAGGEEVNPVLSMNYLSSLMLAPADMSMKKAKKTLLRFRVWLVGLRCRDDFAAGGEEVNPVLSMNYLSSVMLAPAVWSMKKAKERECVFGSSF